MEKPSEREGADVYPAHDTCDFCGHPHACYVGGRLRYDPTSNATRWERHVCLGCLMRAGVSGALEPCPGSTVPGAQVAATGHRDA